MKKTLLKTILLNTVFTVNMVWSAAPIGTAVVEHTDVQLEALARPLIADNRWNAQYILDQLRQIPASERESSVRLITNPATQLIRDDRVNAGLVLDQLGQISASERESSVRLITHPTTRLIDDSRRDAEYILFQLRHIPGSERESLIRLITDPMTRLVRDDRRNAGLVLEQLRQIHASERDSLVRLITNPTTRLIQDDRLFASDVLRQLRQIRQDQRFIKIARVLLFFRGVAIDWDRFRLIIETPLMNHIPAAGAGMMAMGEMENPYAAGINVHHGDRDRRTADAFKKLWDSQGEVTTEVIDANYAAFTDYLKAADDALQTKVNRVLHGGGSGFGGLLGNVSSCGLHTTGKELIARLWAFACTGDEQDNKKRAILSALQDSIDHGSVVCNPGKLQRLATSVLQGYLPGVNIDGEGFVPETMIVTDAPMAGAGAAGHVPVMAAEVVPEPLNIIRNHQEIEMYLKPLLSKFGEGLPSLNDFFRQTIEYVERLRFGEIPGAGHVHVDLKEVLHLFIIGNGDGLSMAADITGMFNVDDYMAQFAERDQLLRDMADPEAARRRAEAETLARVRAE